MSSAAARPAVANDYPLHWLVWHNDYEELDKELSKDLHNKELSDPRGRTPLHLAVTLGHLESTRVLLRHGCSTTKENKEYWTALQEAVSTGDPELVQLVLKHRDHQRFHQRSAGVPELLQRLKETPDFYVEMKWEFTSWVPLVSRMCPNDVYKVYKCGSSVRIDTTLLGFDNMSWQRGKRSYIFKGLGETATVMEVDHDRHEVFSESMRIVLSAPDVSLMQPSEESVAARLTAPIVTTYIDTEKISFERNKSGIWGWRSDKQDQVNGYSCKVFSAGGVEVKTKTRTEHLTEQDKTKSKKLNKTPLESFLGVAEVHNQTHGASNGEIAAISYNPCSITPEEYFDKSVQLEDRDIGRPIEQTTKTQKFKATLSLCEDYPLSLQEQVIPIIDLMAATNAHFQKLRDFITLQLPAGFPIKIEIPLFHILNARITFGNIFSSVTPQSGVQCIMDEPMSCSVDELCFDPPATYMVMGDGHYGRLRDEDDELLQFALQQSLLDAGTEDDQVTFLEAINKTRPPPSQNDVLQVQEERLLQRAIAASMRVGGDGSDDGEIDDAFPMATGNSGDHQVSMALEMSRQVSSEAENRRKQQVQDEQDQLEMILKLSLTDK